MALVRRMAKATATSQSRLLSQMGDEMRDQVLAILQRQADVLGKTVEALIRQLGPQNLDLLLSEIDWVGQWETPLRAELANSCRQILVRGATAELERMGLHRNLVFNLDNPRALAYARDHVPNLVREVTVHTQEAIRDRVGQGFSTGLTTREMAKEIREVVGLTSRQGGAVTRLRETLTAQGAPPAVVDKQAAQYQARLLRQRAKLIADTESVRAYNAGTQAAWQSAGDGGWIDTTTALRHWSVGKPLTAGGRACDVCVQIAAFNSKGVKLDEPFLLPGGSGTVHLPPAHPGCRCGVTMRFG